MVGVFLFQLPAEYLPIPKGLECREKDYIGTSSTSPCLMSCVSVVFDNGALTGSLQRATFCLSNSLGCLEISMGNMFGEFPWATTQLNATQCCHWKLFLAIRDAQSRLYISHY